MKTLSREELEKLFREKEKIARHSPATKWRAE